MDELEDLHKDQTNIFFTIMEAKCVYWDPVKLDWSSSNSLLTVLRQYFHCGTFC